MSEKGAPDVNDVWKASAYGDLEKLTGYVTADPKLLNEPDATGYVDCGIADYSLSSGARSTPLLPNHLDSVLSDFY